MLYFECNRWKLTVKAVYFNLLKWPAPCPEAGWRGGGESADRNAPVSPARLCNGRLSRPFNQAQSDPQTLTATAAAADHSLSMCSWVWRTHLWVCTKGVFGSPLGVQGGGAVTPLCLPIGLLSKHLCYDSWTAFRQTKSQLSAVHFQP